jgi:hypothetical protein
VDYASTQHASRARWDKAHELARWCWEQGLTPDHIQWITDGDWARLSRRAIGRPASEQTRQLVHALIVTKAAHVAAFNPTARRTVLTEEQVAALIAGARR